MFRKIAFAAAAATISAAGAASAADLPSKKSVPSLVAEEPSAIHGFMDFGYANGRVTGGGNPLYASGAALFQSDVGAAIDLYKSKSGLINSFSVFAGVWAEDLTNPAAGHTRMQEYDWWAGASVGFADYYKLTVQSLQFQLQATDKANPGAQVVVKNATASLSYDDAHLGLPIALNPSVTVIYNLSGGATLMPLGDTSTYRVDLAIAPGYSFLKSAGIPLSLSVPTSISLGPTNDYYLSSYKGCGSANAVKNSGSACSTSTFEMFSTGLQAKYDLGQFIPKKFGSWTAKAGVQYYQFLSDALKANQGGAMSSRKSNSTVISAGLGVSF
jgi:hypothetical protein